MRESRRKNFKEPRPEFEEKRYDDPRFGQRTMYLNKTEVPSIFSYMEPGKGQNGEHQN